MVLFIFHVQTTFNVENEYVRSLQQIFLKEQQSVITIFSPWNGAWKLHEQGSCAEIRQVSSSFRVHLCPTQSVRKGKGDPLYLSVLVGTDLYFVCMSILSLLVVIVGGTISSAGQNQFWYFWCFSAFFAKFKQSLKRLSAKFVTSSVLNALL